MSYSSMNENPQLWIPETDTLAIRESIKLMLAKSTTVIDSSKIISARNAEEWVNQVIEWLLHNLIHDVSAYGRFWSPDKNIVQAIVQSWDKKKLWVKLLWIKMGVLIHLLPSLPISELHKDRIRNIDTILREKFKSKN